MHRRRTPAVLLAGLAAVAIVALAAAGCSSGSGGATSSPSPTAQWRKVLTREVSGAQPVKLNLGTYDLGPAARLQWELSGPAGTPPAALTFRIINQENGVGYGNTVTPRSDGFKLDDPAAIVLAPIWKGTYRVFFSQRFAAGKGPGYDATITIWTANE